MRNITERAKKIVFKEEFLKDFSKEKEFDDWAVELGKKAKKGRLKRLEKLMK
jgi:hypothetical protein